MIIQACLNGNREPAFHPALPTTAEAIAREGAAAVTAGANELHVHVRRADGRETLTPDVVDDTVARLRRSCPGTLIGISTAVGIEKDDARRRDCIRHWSVLPDYASVNLVEDDSAAVIELLEQRGIGIEAGIWTAADAERYLNTNLKARPLRFLFEINQQDETEARAELAAIEDRLGDAVRQKSVLLHGAGAMVWLFVREAFARGYSTRVGLEDGAGLPDGRIAPSNAALVAAALDLKNKQLVSRMIAR